MTRSVIARSGALLSEYCVSEPFARLMIGQRPGPGLARLAASVVFFSALVGALIALLHPSSSVNLDFFDNFLLWSLHALAAFIFTLGAEFLLLRTPWRRPYRLAVTLLLLPFFLAPVSILLDEAFDAEDIDGPMPGGRIAAYISEVLDIAPLAVPMMALALLLARLIVGRAAEVPAPVPTPAGDEPAAPPRPRLAALLDGVPAALGDDLVRLSAQDHYVEVVTTAGRHLLLARLADCVDRLGALDGVQTHRSHWVRLSHVTGLRAAGSAYECVLSNGDVVPVSRRRYSSLRHLIRARIG
ncbi:LytTR family DNA-binding domain-containing protein [Eilatimonas milleporae]|uniref:LytTr DNA-binding domain-containing protein n=1 Tax=Eilatimonas milleporae TaxID=911205 RepID=A0A3M0CFE9_9PROT|nr:LytTR family DNA-binding domain-containing protein [Eilatimonas milleporae]RMB08122.1 LytTr DNA-binding domain-containing protein [Eilatimonas milleporae]